MGVSSFRRTRPRESPTQNPARPQSTLKNHLASIFAEKYPHEKGEGRWHLHAT